jgi:hypothetical protein
MIITDLSTAAHNWKWQWLLLLLLLIMAHVNLTNDCLMTHE